MCVLVNEFNRIWNRSLMSAERGVDQPKKLYIRLMKDDDDDEYDDGGVEWYESDNQYYIDDEDKWFRCVYVYNACTSRHKIPGYL